MTSLPWRGAAAALVAALALSGCQPGSLGPEERDLNEKANSAIVADLTDRLADPGYRLDLRFLKDGDGEPSVSADLECESCDSEAIVTSIVEAVWLSKVTPLANITVYVNVAGEAFDARDFDLSEDAETLEAQFGPRPVPIDVGD